MIIATVEQKELDDIIVNKYIKSKEELDNIIYNTAVYTEIYLEDSFIQQEFILKSHDILDYKEYVNSIRPNINLMFDKDIEQLNRTFESLAKHMKDNRELALFILRDVKIMDTLRNITNIITKNNTEKYRSMAKIEDLISQMNEITNENDRLTNSNIILNNNIKQLKSRLQSVKKLNYTINLDKFSTVVMFKTTESMKHMYSLSVEFRNKLTSLNISSSMLVLLPHGSVIDTKKWQERGFIDLREPKVIELLETNKAVTDLYQELNISTFINNQKTNTLIIVDKTLGNYFPFECNNMIMISVGRQKLSGIDGILDYGEIKESDLSNASISELMDYYCNNDCINSVIRRITNG